MSKKRWLDIIRWYMYRSYHFGLVWLTPNDLNKGEREEKEED